MDEKSNLKLKVSFILTGKYRKNPAFIQQFCNRTVKHKYKICFRVYFSEFQKKFEKSLMQQKNYSRVVNGRTSAGPNLKASSLKCDLKSEPAPKNP